MSYKEVFKDKKITMLGLGLLGRGINVAKFLARAGAVVTITDKKSATELAPALKQLKQFSNITYVLGEHRLEDFQHADMVIKAAGVSLDSPYIAEARKNNIPVEMDASLFARLVPAGITLAGITGTRGKSTVTHAIYHILTKGRRRVFLGGNVRGLATLPLLAKVKPGDIVVLELDSWQLQGFAESKLSPHIAVFTNLMPDHLNYYGGDMQKYFTDKSAIFAHQTSADTLILGPEMKKILNTYQHPPIKSQQIYPSAWKGKSKLLGEHNTINLGLAAAAGKALGLSERQIARGLASFAGVPGRLELVRTVRGVKWYNDTTATTPEAVLAALKALATKKKVILIAGGADKNLDWTKPAKLLPKYAREIILLPGTGTAKLNIAQAKLVQNLPEAITLAASVAKRGDTVLLSPGFASFGLFKNEYDRGDQFVKLVKKLK
jgi:UDP-N-acetylmuramoylalanine--D-glutamate ligase